MFWQSIVDSLVLATVVVDDRLSVCFHNKEAENLVTGIGINFDFVNLFEPEERDKITAAFAIDSEYHNVIEVKSSHEGRRPLTISLRIGKKHQGLRLIQLTDVTAFKNLEEEIVQSRKMQAIGQLAGGIAHDFNNVLTVMIGYCDLLLLRHRVGDPSFGDVMQIRQNATRAASLVHQLMAFSRQQKLEPRLLDVTEMLSELDTLLSRTIGGTIILEIIHGIEHGFVMVDHAQFEQVIINLVVNARDAMPTGGKLTIRTSALQTFEPVKLLHEIMPPGDYILIEVIDNGTGIAGSDLDRIFEPFYTTKPIGDGTGLGLSTVYGIVRQTGGFVAVTSQFGYGSCFSIYLPRCVDGTSTTPPEITAFSVPKAIESQELAKTCNGITILLVDDEEPVCLCTALSLRGSGYVVIEAHSGEEGLDVLYGKNGDKIDLLITDAMMPVMDGPTMIERARVKYPNLRVLCVSGRTDEGLRTRLAALENVFFLPKPFGLRPLITKVTEILASPCS